MAEFVTLEVSDNGVGMIRLARPPVNALSAQVSQEIAHVVTEAAADRRVRSVVVWGGEKVFAAGADVKEMRELDAVSIQDYIEKFQGVFTQLARMPKVTIAAINGYALGGGCELALACDFRVCADNSRLGQPEILLGVIPGAGGTQRLPRLVGVGRAKELVFSGRMVAAEEALAIGLVDRVVPADEVAGAARELAERYAAGPPLALKAAKHAIDEGLEIGLDAGLLIERQAFSSLFSTEDQKEGMRSFVEEGPGKATFAGR
ncbi:MAG TPA: enoyl-CoA hydratase-related protein [Actinomycetota bacterium]|nr:enoyl-CoA hydratase-related protein [Actinomycetota bacterium]